MNKLFFDEPANNWQEALPLGNGFLGAMVYGKNDKELIEMNEDSLWSGPRINRRNPDASKSIDQIRELLKLGEVEQAQKLSVRNIFSLTPHSRHYQPLGQVWIELSNQLKPLKYRRELNLENAVMKIENDDALMRECFISYPDQVMVYQLMAKQEQSLNFDLYLTRRDTRSGKTVSYLENIECVDNIIYLSGYNGNQNEGISYTMAATVKINDGTVTRFGSRLVIEGATSATIYVTGRTTFRSDDPNMWCKDCLNRALAKSYEQLKKEHIQDYQKYYDQIHLEFLSNQTYDYLPLPQRLKQIKKGITDPQFYALYFNFARYLLISCSREGSLPANLQGIWANEFEPSWGSKYTININTQMNYWMAEKTGLSNLHLSLMELIKIMLPRAKETANQLYNCKGACAHHNTDIWGDCDPMDYNSSSTIWPVAYIWLALHIIEHYKYTYDNDFISQYFEILHQNVQFILDYMYIDQNGYLATGPSVSPENTYKTKDGVEATVCYSPTMDIAIIREFLTGYLDICRLCDKSDFVEEVKEHLTKLPPIKIGKYNQIMEWQDDYEEIELGHRHISHLFGLYPGTQIQWDQESKLVEAAKNTLSRRIQYGGGHTGWSCAWITHFYARLHEKEKCYKMMQKLFCDSTLDNLFDNCPPFQIDGNFGGGNAILEMLVQDFDDVIYLLPALPDSLNSGHLKRLRLKCGAELTIEWEDGIVTKVFLKSQRETRLVVKMNDQELIVQLKENETYYI